jgi:PAS domain-containing protein
MEDLLESTVFEVVADEQAAMTEWSRERAADRERSGFQAETRLRRPDGRIAVALVSATLMRNPRGEPLYYICQFFDLTRRNEAQERLVANEAKLAEAQQLARLGSWEWEIATDTVVWSDELYRIYGVRPDRFPGPTAATWTRCTPTTAPAWRGSSRPRSPSGAAGAWTTASCAPTARSA